MGGFYHVLADVAGEAGSKLASAFKSPKAAEFGEAIENGLYRGVFNPARSFEEHPQANQVYQDFQNKYKPAIEKNKNMLLKQHQAAGTPIDQQLLDQIHGQSKKIASLNTFGPKRVIIQNMLKNVESSLGKNKADVLSDHLNILFEESAPETGPSRMSQFTSDMRGGGKRSINPTTDFEAPNSTYKDSTTWEKGLRKGRSLLAYKAMPIHAAAGFLNAANEDGVINLGKAFKNIWGPSRAGTIARIQASNAISEISIKPIQEEIAYNAAKANNKIFKFLPNSVGEFVHRNMYVPGMPMARKQSIYAGAELGRLMAVEATEHLKAGNNKWALPALKSLDLDAGKIAAQGYQLNPEDIAKAYYHGANNRVFLHPYDTTPTFWRQSPLWRSMKAFTGYISSQSTFERRVLKKQFAQGDFVGIARNIGLKSLVIPLVGASIYEADRLAGGADWDDPAGHLGNRLDATPAGQIVDPLIGRQNGADAAKTTLNTIDMIARLGVFGNTTGYIRGMNRASLMERFAPPEANMFAQGLQDADKALHYDFNHPQAADPLGRDIMSDFIPFGIGSIASHQLLPTKKEEDAGKYKRPRRHKQKAESNNPFNYNIDENY